MIAYFDTSAIVKLLIAEDGSETAARAWRASDARICAAVGLTEAVAAIARAQRLHRIDTDVASDLFGQLEQLWTGVSTLIIDDELAIKGAMMAVDHALRGYDAVHLAAAGTTAATFVGADTALLAAAAAIGLDTVDCRR